MGVLALVLIAVWRRLVVGLLSGVVAAVADIAGGSRRSGRSTTAWGPSQSSGTRS